MMTFNNIIDLRNQKVMTQLVLLKEYINMSSFSKARLMYFITTSTNESIYNN